MADEIYSYTHPTDTAAGWALGNRVLALGEVGYDSTNNELRAGNGIDLWASLTPIAGDASGTVDQTARDLAQQALSAAGEKYTKPSTGIPQLDLDSATSGKINAAGTAYQKPAGGIPDTDLASTFIKTVNGNQPDTSGNIVVSGGGGGGAVSSVAGKTGDVTLNKSDVGLSNVTNTSDADKPVSTAQATAIGAKYAKPSDGIPKTDLASGVQTSLGKADTALQSAPVTSVAGKTGAVSLAKGDVGLGNVDNTSDANKPVSTAVARRTWVSVKDYGALGVGTDDTSAIQQAMTAVGALGGGVVFLPKGVYGIDANKGDQATYSNNVRGGIRAVANVTLQGEGMFATVLKNIADNSTSVVQNRGVSGFEMHDMTIDVDWPNKTSMDLATSSTRGEAIVYWNGVGAANDNKFSRILIKNTGHYGFGIQNVEVNRLEIESCFGTAIGGDFIDIKEFTANGSTPAYPKTAWKVTHCWADGVGLNATAAQQEADAAAFDFRGEGMASDIHVYGLNTYNEPDTGNPMPSVAGIRINGDVAANNRLGGRKVRVIGGSVTSSKAVGEGTDGGPKQIIGVRVGNSNATVMGVVVDNCYIGFRVIQTGDSNPSGAQIIGCHALNCRGGDGLGKGVSIEGAGTSIGAMLDVTVSNCDIGVASTNSVGAVGRFSLSGNTKDHNVVADQLRLNMFTFASQANLVTDISRPTRTNANDMTIWGTTGPTLRLRSTFNGTWTSPYDDGVLSFESEDTSGAGAGVRAEVRARMTGSTGGGTGIVLRANGGSGLTDVVTINADRVYINTAVLPSASNDSAAASAGVLVGGLYRNGSVLMVRVA